MRDKLRTHAILCLTVFLLSLLIFAAALPRFGLYLALLSAAEWICILLYRGRENRPFFLRVLLIGLGNILAYTLQWFLLGRDVSPAELDVPELLLLVPLLAGAVCILFALRPGERAPAGDTRPGGAGPEASHLFPEREHDLRRLEGFLRSGAPLIGVDALWGDGKTFLIDHLCAQPQTRERYEIVRIHALAGNEDELELTLMNEFDRILRRNRIFSLSSKQMIKLLESSDLLKQLRWLLIEDTQSVSTTFSSVLRDLEKLDKPVLIIVDDIERLGDPPLIRKLFALMESVSSGNIQIVYLFNSRKLEGFDRSYLEKYIPCSMTLTPVRFSSLVRAFWDELHMDAAGLPCKDVADMAESPKSSFSVTQILSLEPGDLPPFRLDTVTVRKVRVFLEEFRDLICPDPAQESSAGSPASTDPRKLLAGCLFIKHFLPECFETLAIGTSVADSPLFRLNDAAAALLGEKDLRTPDRVSLLSLLGIRRCLRQAGAMRQFMQVVLADRENANRLTALSMLGFDFSDLWREIQKLDRPQAKQSSAADARICTPMMIHAEQLGNESVSDIARERNNERIDRVMWNLLANGTSELSNLDAYVRLFQQEVLAAAPDARRKAWQTFTSDTYHGRIHKDNVTRRVFGADPYLPLFQGFRVTNASPRQWLELLDFYFRFAREDSSDISVELLQNLNYVDMTDSRVCIAVLRFFTQCRIIGNPGQEPCMYRFLKRTLRSCYALGYTTDDQFYEIWYSMDTLLDTEDLLPSRQWEAAVKEAAKHFVSMKSRLEKDKLTDPGFSWFNSDLDVIIHFIDKCEELLAEKTPVRMRTLRVDIQESSSYSRHQSLCDTLQAKRQAGADPADWLRQVRSAYEAGKLDPREIRDLLRQAGPEPAAPGRK